MTEIINNRQQRIEIMKSLVRQLHDGSGEEKIRKQLETMLDEADYSDVFVMEVQLIEEGIPEESIPQTNPGHPVHTFVEENKELTKLTQRIRLLIKKVDQLKDDQDALPLMQDIQSLLNELMDVDKHYRRKENLLFPYFEKNDVPGPPAVMWGKHDETRTLLKGTILGLQQTDQILADEARAYNLFAVSTALESVEDMIYKEEKIILPTALDLLTEEDWYLIYLESPEIGYCLYVPEFDWMPEGVDLSDLAPSVSKSDRVQMPTGSFQLEELIRTFSALPFDLTFVDKDDTVRYFSPGKNRVFERSRTILGRKVQYCHPPKSVHIVNQILADFKSGDQDQARFWIQMGPRLVYIVYYALRGEDGSYQGTLEVTQDATGIRELDGERRLLEYDQ